MNLDWVVQNSSILHLGNFGIIINEIFINTLLKNISYFDLSKKCFYKAQKMLINQIMDNIIDLILLISQLIYQLFNATLQAVLTAAMIAYKMAVEIAAISFDLTFVILQHWQLFE